jgi:hypothetical protein
MDFYTYSNIIALKTRMHFPKKKYHTVGLTMWITVNFLVVKHYSKYKQIPRRVAGMPVSSLGFKKCSQYL